MDNKIEYDLKLILLAAREKKGLSQRKLAKKVGMHHSSLNDLENGKIKKVDVELLRKIAEELDLSLELLLKAAGYSQVAFMFKQGGSSLDTKSTRDLKNIIPGNSLEIQWLGLHASTPGDLGWIPGQGTKFRHAA